MTDTVQLTLPIGPLAQVDGRHLTIDERFAAFDAANPWVYAALEKLTADWLYTGHKRVGMKMLTEVLRWQYARQTTGSDFKLDNSLTSRYARKLVAEHPEWAGAIEMRKLRAA